MDPVHHLLRWIHVSRLDTGLLFRRFDMYDRPVMTGSCALVLSTSSRLTLVSGAVH
jgi:hypothetical protein